MEAALFVPCTRMHDLMRAWNVNHEHDEDDDEVILFSEEWDMTFEEVELRVGAENGAVDLFHQYPDFTFDNLWCLASRKIVWMSPDIFIESLATHDDSCDICDVIDNINIVNCLEAGEAGLTGRLLKSPYLTSLEHRRPCPS
jgi:hypothetical protein